MRLFGITLVLLCGCAGAELPVQDAHVAVEKAGTQLQTASKAAAALGRTAVALCSLPALHGTQECDGILDSYDVAASALNDVINAYNVIADVLVRIDAVSN